MNEGKKKSWIEENYGDEDWVTDDIDANKIRVYAIEEVCQKILEEVDKDIFIGDVQSARVRKIIKKLGVDL